MNYKVAVAGLKMGNSWAQAALELPNAELVMVYDPNFDKLHEITRKRYTVDNPSVRVAEKEEELYESNADIIVVASPDRWKKDCRPLFSPLPDSSNGDGRSRTHIPEGPGGQGGYRNPQSR